MIKIEISNEHVSGLVSFYESELTKAQAKVDEIKSIIATLKGKNTAAAPAPVAAAIAPAKGKRGRPATVKPAKIAEVVKTPGKRGRKPKSAEEKKTKVTNEGPKGRPGRRPKPVPAWTSEVQNFVKDYMESQMDTFTTNDLKHIVYQNYNTSSVEERTTADKFIVEALKNLSSSGTLMKYKDQGSKENRYTYNRG